MRFVMKTVLLMVGVRKLIYAAGGETYIFGDWGTELLYEYRKDVSTYAMSVVFIAFAQWLLAPVAEPEGEAEPLLIADGSLTHRVPVDEIDWISSAANYVEIGWGERTLLHRSTLAAMAERRLELTKLTTHSATLEDVFVALTGRQLREA